MNDYRNGLCIFPNQTGNLGGVPKEKVRGKHCSAAQVVTLALCIYIFLNMNTRTNVFANMLNTFRLSPHRHVLKYMPYQDPQPLETSSTVYMETDGPLF